MPLIRKDELFPPIYRNALEAAQQELQVRLQQQQELANRIQSLRATIASLQVVAGQQEAQAVLHAALGFDPTGGITKSIKNLLAFNPSRKFTASEIQQQLAVYGFDFSKYSHALAVLCSTLNRLEQGGLVKLSHTTQGFALYEWAGPPPPQGGF
jgi:hypothetical protein